MSRKIGRNDPCWCGSGRKYKKYHLSRAEEISRPWPALVSELRQYFNVKQCLHPLASRETCGKVVAAHTIQRKGALEAIIDDKAHCFTFFPVNGRDETKPKRRGWREASTFAGFCDQHDGITFAPLERQEFVGSPEQCFLIAYRTGCHELYQKQGADRSHKAMRQLLDRGKTPEIQRAIQHLQHGQEAGVRKGLEEAHRNKTRMDSELLAQQFESWKHLFVRFEGPISVVSTGCSTPNRSLSGDELQVLHDPHAYYQRLCFGVVRTQTGGAVIFLWRPEDRAPERLIAELKLLPVDQLPGVIVQFMFAYVENSYFSVSWWDSLSAPLKRHIARLACMGNPYYTSWRYVRDLPVPWHITQVSHTWAAG